MNTEIIDVNFLFGETKESYRTYYHYFHEYLFKTLRSTETHKRQLRHPCTFDLTESSLVLNNVLV